MSTQFPCSKKPQGDDDLEEIQLRLYFQIVIPHSLNTKQSRVVLMFQPNPTILVASAS